MVQASANTSEPNILDSTNPDNWTYNWGSESLYANTITVGMWNTDPQDHWHATSPHLMPEIDIYADGVKNTFDWSLGTSYATPAVAAEVVNFCHMLLAMLSLQVLMNIMMHYSIFK